MLGDVINGVRFLPRAWGRAWAALALLAVLLALPAAVPGLAGPGAAAATAAAQGAALLIAGGALLRLAAGGRAGLGGLGFGGLELRLLASLLLCLLFLALIDVVLALILAGAFGAVGLEQADLAGAAALPAWKTVLLWGLTLGSVLILAVLGARLALAGPATAAEGKVASLGVLRLSRGRGRGFGLLFALLFAAAPLIGLGVWAVVDMTEAVWKDVVWALVLAFVQAPLTAGTLTSAYRRLAALGGGGDDARA